MLKRIFGGRDKPSLDTDAALDDMELRAARAAVQSRGDWRAAQAVIAAAGRDWERRGHRCGVLAGVVPAGDGWLGGWLAASPDDPTAWTLKASVDSDRAGEARGSASAANTTAEQFRLFEELMAVAEQTAQRAIKLGPDDPTPWVNYLWSLFPDGRTKQFAVGFAELRARDPYHYTGHEAALQFYAEKWYGSHDKMYEMARATAASAPPGAAVNMLPIQGHIEYCLREYFWDANNDVAGNVGFWRKPAVQRELDACVANWRAGGSPPHALAMKTRSVQALAYMWSGRHAEAARVFAEIGPYLGGGYPWYYLGRDSAKHFTTYRDLAMKTTP
jgi:hypothetical protein